MIEKLQLKGFQAHRDSILNFSPGVNIILGDSDVGKSAIIRAIGWLNFNRPSGDAFVNAKVPECSVALTTKRGEAERIRKPSNGYLINKTVMTAVGRTVPDELKGVLNLSEINFQKQLEPYFLVLQTPGAISKYISEVFGFDVVDKAIASAKSNADQARKEADDLDLQVRVQTERLRALEGLETLDAQVRAAEKTEESILKLKDGIWNVTRILDQLEQENKTILEMKCLLDEASFVDALSVLQEIEKIEECLTTFESTQIARKLVQLHTTNIELVQNQLIQKFQELGACPLCFSHIDEQKIQEMTQHL